MLGRGTRKGEKYPDKSHFTVFDCFDGTLIEYFRQATGITAEPLEKESRTIAQVIQDIWDNRDRDYNTRCLVKRLQRIDKEMSSTGREQFAAFIESGDMARYAKDLPKRLRDDFAGAMKLLRDEKFQDLLVNYDRARRTFIEAPGVIDEVSSSWLIRGADGKEYKPVDYLAAFAQFVKENPEHIEAIRILQKSPEAWSTQALSELREKLSKSQQRFTEDNLQKAHQVHYHKALVDVISMVKRAADGASPLLTAQERVERAFLNVTAGKTFTPEQLEWLGCIKNHLVKNLSIDQDDFETMPIFTRIGGWGRATKVFTGQLPQLIHSFNQAIAL
jgi:type I restriction enzyme R subunit